MKIINSLFIFLIIIISIFLVGLFVDNLNLLGFIIHDDYSSFSSNEDRITKSNLTFDVTDDVIYSLAYISYNGGAWNKIHLLGNSYNNSEHWLNGSGSINLPIYEGEHYFLIYSCSGYPENWDCHPRNNFEKGFWQLYVFSSNKGPKIYPSLYDIDVTASSYDLDYNTLPNLTLDGSLNSVSRWSSDEKGGWIQFNLPDTYKIDGISLAFYRGNQRATNITIETSLDGISWMQVFNGWSKNNTLDYNNFFFPERDVNYIRVLGYGNDGGTNWTSITEADFLYKNNSIITSRFLGNNNSSYPSQNFTIDELNDLLCPLGNLSNGEDCPSLAFPTAKGYGRFTQGGRGGQVLHVTTLEDGHGSGTLRNALGKPYPRIIVFDVSGTINLSLGDLKIKNPYITIAGQTAPGDGIAIKGGVIWIETHNVVIRHLRLRTGDTISGDPDSTQAIGINSYTGATITNMIFDHISGSWGIDGIFDIWPRGATNGDITFQNCIISETLYNSIHSEGTRGKAFLVGDYSKNISILNNLFAHNDRRHPHIKGGTINIDIINNVIYNWGTAGIHFNQGGSGPIKETNILNNYFKSGSMTTREPIYGSWGDFQGMTPDSTIFIDGNIIDDGTINFIKNTSFCYNNYDCSRDFLSDSGEFNLLNSISRPVEGHNTITAEKAYGSILNDVGATLPNRDSVDIRIIQDVINRTGGYIDSPSEVGGWPVLNSEIPLTDTDYDGIPDYWESFHCLNSVLDDSRNYDLSAIYTNIEVYLNDLAGDFGESLLSLC